MSGSEIYCLVGLVLISLLDGHFLEDESKCIWFTPKGLPHCILYSFQ